MMNVYEKLLKIQLELKAPKGQFNSFGKYSYRSCEDIQEAVKPLLKDVNCVLVIGDEMVQLGDRYYVKATASFIDCEGSSEQLVFVRNTAFAREDLDKKGMDDSQITGSASSYARKYALNGLFCIDDVKDADTQEPKEKKPSTTATQKPIANNFHCETCNTPFTPFDWKDKHYTASDGYEIAKKKCGGKALCNKCKKEAGIS